MKKCLTPGSTYNISIYNNSVVCEVILPVLLNVNATEAEALENEIHDAMEKILAKYYKAKDLR